MAGLSMAGTVAQAWEPPLVVNIINIKFNHNTGSSSSDAITLNSGYDTTITAPEWSSSAASKEIAYKQGSTGRTVKASFTHNQGGAVTSLHISASALPYSDASLYITSQQANFSSGFCTDKQFSCSGSTGSGVGEKDLGLGWQVQKVNGVSYSQFISNTDHDFYALVDYPTAPFDGSDQAGPWTEVLDYSYDWANGLTSSTAAACSVATGIFYDWGAFGGAEAELYYYDSEDLRYVNEETGAFALGYCLSEIGDEDQENVNCYEVACLFQLFSASIGCDSKRIRIYGDGGYFTTEDLNPIGYNSSSWNYQGWTNHYFGRYSSKVFDDCLRLNESSPEVPVNWTQGSYESDLIASGSYTVQDSTTVDIFNP